MSKLIAYVSVLWADPERTHYITQLESARNILLERVTLDDIRQQLHGGEENTLLDLQLAPYAEHATRITCEFADSAHQPNHISFLHFFEHFSNLLLLATESPIPVPQFLAAVDKAGTSEANYIGNFQRGAPPSNFDPEEIDRIQHLDKQFSRFLKKQQTNDKEKKKEEEKGFRKLERAIKQLCKSVRQDWNTHADFFDSFVETAIGTESLFNDGDAEVTYTLSMRVAAFNGTSPEARHEIFHFMRGCYSLRSTLVHGSDLDSKVIKSCFKKYIKLTGQDLQDQAAIKNRFMLLLRQTILRLLQLQLTPMGSTFDEYVVGLRSPTEISWAT